MDHIPLPDSNPLTHIEVPYFGIMYPEFQYDYLGFDGFLSRKGFKEDVESLKRLDGGLVTINEYACILQLWCVVGLLIEVFKIFGVDLVVEDFLLPHPDCTAGCTPVLTTAPITSLLRTVVSLSVEFAIMKILFLRRKSLHNVTQDAFVTRLR